MRRLAALPSLALAAAVSGCGHPVPPPTRTPAPRVPARADVYCLDERARDVIARVNDERKRRGLPALEPDERLQEAAQRHAADMARGNFMAHEGSDHSMVTDRADRSGYRWTTIAENVAAGYPDPAAVVTGWMNSPGHRSNILDGGVRHTGVGFAYRTDTPLHSYWVQVFGQTQGVTAATARC